MQISTMISTRVILSEAELKEAAIEFVKARTEVPADATFAVDFEDDNAGDLTAVVDITGTAGSAGTTTPAADKPKATRSPKTTVTKTPEPAAETKAEEPPFVEDLVSIEEAKVIEQLKVEETQAEEVQVAEPQPENAKVETKSIGRIFPETSTSAPPAPPPEEVDPAVKAKSLFANLSKPTN
jgi:hypothetical protein